MYKRAVFTLGLILILLLTACTQENDTYRNVMEITHHYAEEKIDDIFNRTSGYSVISKTEEGTKLANYNWKGDFIDSQLVDPNTSLIVKGTEHEEGYAILKLKMEGSEVSKADIDIFDVKGNLIDSKNINQATLLSDDLINGQFQFLSDGYYAICRLDNNIIIDTNDDSYYNINGLSYGMTSIGDGVIAFVQDEIEGTNSKIEFYDLEKQSEISEYTYEEGSLQGIIYDEAQNSFIGVAMNGLVEFNLDHYKISSSEWLRKIEIPYLKGDEFEISDGKLLMIENDIEKRIYEENQEIVDPDEVELVALNGIDVSSFVDQFNRQSEGAKIKINDFQGDLARYQNQMGTRVMADDAPELFVTSGLNLESLYDKGYIGAIDELMKGENAIDWGKLDGCFVKGVTYKDNKIALPVSRYLKCWVYDTSNLSEPFLKELDNQSLTIEKLEKFLIDEKENGLNAMINLDPESFTNELIQTKFTDLWDDEGNFTEEAKLILLESLDLAKDYQDKGLLSQEGNGIISERYVTSYFNLFGLSYEYDKELSIQIPMASLEGEQGNKSLMTALAVSSQLTDKQEKVIEDFFNFILSESVQNKMEDYSREMPVLKTAIDFQKSQSLESKSTLGYFDGETVRMNAFNPILADQLDEVIRMSQINLTRDYKIDEIINEEVERFVKGELTAEQAADNIISKYNTYRSEQY